MPIGCKHDKLALVIKMILTLKSWIGIVESEFSINKTILTGNMNSETIVHMLSHDLQPNTINLSNSMLLAVKSGREKYQVYLNQQKEAKVITESDNQKSILVDEIKQVETKCDSLLKTCSVLNKDFVECVKNACREGRHDNAGLPLKKAGKMVGF